MTIKCFIVFLVFITSQLIICQENDDKTEVSIVETEILKDIPISNEIEFNHDDIFVPTNEWQKVREGQAIPQGLHVRLNVQTGEKEAKLLDEEPRFNYNEIKQAIKNIKDESKFKELNEFMGNELPQDVLDTKNEYRSYESLKEDFKKSNLNIKTDGELITELIEKFNKTKDVNEKLAYLIDFEYYVHQYDNGLLLCDLNGFKLIMNELNLTDSQEIKIKSSLVLGSAIQGNPKVQIYALENGLLQLVLNKLSLDRDSEALSLKYVFVLSSFLRNFPYAQHKFIEYGGLQTIRDYLIENKLFKVNIKLLTLLSDLLKEKSQVLEESLTRNDDLFAAKLAQYKKVNLQEKLFDDNSWCIKLSGILKNSHEHDQREKVLYSIKTLIPTCSGNLDLVTLTKHLNHLESEYKELSKNDTEDDNYFKKILNVVNDLRTELENLKKKKIYDEDL